MTDYKKSKSFEERLSESNRIIEKYPDRLPIIVERKNTCKLNNIDKNKFLVPSDMALTQFIYIIRKRIKLNSAEALFFFIENNVPVQSSTILELYNIHKDKDGFLYIIYNSENTFG